MLHVRGRRDPARCNELVGQGVGGVGGRGLILGFRTMVMSLTYKGAVSGGGGAKGEGETLL